MNKLLTKDTNRFFSLIYKEYLIKCDTLSKSEAKCFNIDDVKLLFPDINENDIYDCIHELKDNLFIEHLDITGNFDISNNGIIYMENKVGNTIEKVIDYISKLKI